MLPSKKVLTVNPTSKMDNTKADDFEVEIQDEETLDADDTADNGDDSNQHQDDVARLKAENAKLQRLLNKKPKQEEAGSIEPTIKAELEKVRLEAKGYDDEQVEFLMKFGGASALKDPAIKRVADAMKEEKEQLQAQASSKSQSKSETKYSEDKLRNLSSDEIMKLYREGKIK